MNRITLCAIVALGFALVSTSPVLAAPHCTPSQKSSGDRALRLTAAQRKKSVATHLPWGAPAHDAVAGREMLVQDGYVVEYDDNLLVPIWSAEAVGVKPLEKVKRIDCFRRDVRIADNDKASTPTDYEEDTFDQGHMTPAADQTTSTSAMVNTTIMSNMTPQYCHFNRGIWVMFEEIVRHWVDEHGTLYVLTGSVFKDDPVKRMLSRNGDKRVAVPTRIYKLLAYEADDGSLVTMAVELPNTNRQIAKAGAIAYLKSHIVSLKDLHDDTGLSFFPDLDKPAHETTKATFWEPNMKKVSPIDSACD